MAIYHLNAKVISRSAGRSATAAAAYRAGQKITDERTGLVFDYTRKKEVSYRRIFAPSDSPHWVKDREQLWNAAECAENRKDAQVAREVEVALPIELASSEHIILLERFVQSQFTNNGMVADAVIHNKKGNPHAHILLTTRDISTEGFGQKNRSWNSKEQLEAWRHKWEIQCNRRLFIAGHKCRIDHRSLDAQGLNRIPTVHIGPRSHAMQKKGIQSTNNKLNTFIKEKNMSEENKKNGIPAFMFADDVPGKTELVEAKKRKHLFVTANDYDNHKQYCRAVFSRTYVPVLLELFEAVCTSIDEVETDIGWCYRINLNTGAVYDYGSQIKIENGTDEEVQVVVRLAREKGWKGLHITGNETFREAVFLEAILSGAFTPDQISGYTPTKANLEVIRHCKPTLKIPQEKILKVHVSEQSETGKGGDNSEHIHVPRLKL